MDEWLASPAAEPHAPWLDQNQTSTMSQSLVMMKIQVMSLMIIRQSGMTTMTMRRFWKALGPGLSYAIFRLWRREEMQKLCFLKGSSCLSRRASPVWRKKTHNWQQNMLVQIQRRLLLNNRMDPAWRKKTHNLQQNMQVQVQRRLLLANRMSPVWRKKTHDLQQNMQVQVQRRLLPTNRMSPVWRKKTHDLQQNMQVQVQRRLLPTNRMTYTSHVPRGRNESETGRSWIKMLVLGHNTSQVTGTTREKCWGRRKAVVGRRTRTSSALSCFASSICFFAFHMSSNRQMTWLILWPFLTRAYC